MAKGHMLGRLLCCFGDHDVSEADEDRLFAMHTLTVITVNCSRCKHPLAIWRESWQGDEYSCIEAD